MGNWFKDFYNTGMNIVTDPIGSVKRDPITTLATVAGMSSGAGAAANTLAPSAIRATTGYAKPPAAPASGGVYGGGGGMSGRESNQESLASMFESLLQYSPQLAEQNWNSLAKYAPQEADLSFGLASKYLPQYQALMQQGRTADRTSNMNDVLALSPMLQEIRTASERPEMASMRNLLFSQVGDELASGTRLAPEQERSLAEGMRSSQVARGLSGGQGAANRESVARALEGMNLQTQRQEKAKSLMAMEKSQAPDPFATIMGAPNTAQTAAMSMFQTPANSKVAGSVPGADFYLGNYWTALQNQQAQDRYNTTMQLAQRRYDETK